MGPPRNQGTDMPVPTWKLRSTLLRHFSPSHLSGPAPIPRVAVQPLTSESVPNRTTRKTNDRRTTDKGKGTGQ